MINLLNNVSYICLLIVKSCNYYIALTICFLSNFIKKKIK